MQVLRFFCVFLADDLGDGKITFSATRAAGETVLGPQPGSREPG